VTLLAGTLADLDLASIAQVTSLGRTSLRLELRSPKGEMIGKLVLKAGRVVSATAGGVHGRDALRVILSAASDTRFELAREPLDFALSSALVSIAELGALQRAPLGSTRQPALAGSHPPRAATRPGPAPQVAVRVEVMQGRLDEFDLLTLLQTVGVSRQLIEIEVRDDAGAPAGTIAVKAGKIVSARVGDTAGIDAISQLVTSPRSSRFAVFRMVGDVGQVRELSSVTAASLRAAQGAAPPRTRILAEGALSEFDIPTLLQTVSCSRQHCALEIHDQRTIAGAIFLKAGVVLSARAGVLSGIAAIQHLMSSHPHDRFRLLHLADTVADQVPLGPVSHVVLELQPPEPAPKQTSEQAPEPTNEQVLRPVRPRRAATASQLVRADAPSPPSLVMEGKLSDFDIHTLLETLGATRQHLRLQVLDSDQGQLGEVAVKAGWILSSQVGALGGTDALLVLLGVSKQLRFRVLADAAGGPAVQQPLGAISELLARLAIDRAPPRQPTTRVLRWAIPVSFLVGGMIVFVVLRGWSTHAIHDAPVVAMKSQPAEPAPPVTAPSPSPVTAPSPSPVTAPSTSPAPVTAPPAETTAASPPAETAAAPPPPTETAPATPPPHTEPPVPSAATPPPHTEPPAPSAAPPPPHAEPPAPSPVPPPHAEPPAPSPAAPAETRTPQPDDAATTPPRGARSQPPAPRIGTSIRIAQTALRRLGYDPGPPDNIYGRLTRNAILQFQRAQHLPITGVLDQETWSAIVALLAR
jgi:hypothetical protein